MINEHGLKILKQYDDTELGFTATELAELSQLSVEEASNAINLLSGVGMVEIKKMFDADNSTHSLGMGCFITERGVSAL